MRGIHYSMFFLTHFKDYNFIVPNRTIGDHRKSKKSVQLCVEFPFPDCILAVQHNDSWDLSFSPSNICVMSNEESFAQ